MTKQLTAGKAGTLSIALVDDNGATVDATAVSWTLYDDAGQELATGDADGFTASDQVAKVALTAEQTTLIAPIDGAPVPTSAAREIVLACATSAGEVEVREAFLIVSSAPLQVAVNSFQTAIEAVQTRSEFTQLDGWDRASKTLQRAAMIEAYRRILRVQLQLHAVPDTYNRVAWFERKVPLSRLSTDEFNSLPEGFKRAVKRAQLAEANVLLGGDKIGDKIRAGIISETIGESSMFLNNKPHLNLPISKAAYEELKSYIRFVVEVTRA